MPSRKDLAHLLRRTTFGPRSDEVDTAERNGFDATVRALLDALSADPATDAGAARTPPPQLTAVTDRQQLREQTRTATVWWLNRMVAADHQLHEKLTFFWSGHWATSVQKVRLAGRMLAQQEAFRRYGHGDFALFVKAMLHTE